MPMAILQIHVCICLADRNYVQEETCLPDQDSIPEDLADAVPLAHDDLGCPIRRDRLYKQDVVGATAKPMSGPPVSPSLFRSPRSSAPERPSPKAIQASIKESATLAAAISMQWKEEVSAMRRELAELRRDLCKELRAFNSNFNTFTQHYNTWSPQGVGMATGAGAGLGKGIGTGSGTGTRIGTGLGRGGVPTTSTDKGIGGAREKNPQIAKVSVGIQARSKALVRQSTADAAVNCPEESEEKKSSRRNLPKQLSMDPSILACPQSMYVESAIPLYLDPILPCSTRPVKPEPIDPSVASSTSKPDLQLSVKDTATSPSCLSNKVVITQEKVSLSSERVFESHQDLAAVKQEILITNQQIHIDPTNESLSHAKQPLTEDTKSQVPEKMEIDKIKLPYPVPTVTVSPPEEHDYDITPHQEFADAVNVDKPQAILQDPPILSLHLSGAEESDPSHSTDIRSKTSEITLVSSSDFSNKDTQVCDIQSLDSDRDKPNYSENVMKCPFIVVSEHFDVVSPDSPTDSDTNLDPSITDPDYPSETPPEQVLPGPAFAFSSTESQPNTEPEFQDIEWPPLPEPLDNAPIYHADLVHFDIVMLTSLDQDDLDSVFMDPEPEPFDLSADSSFNADDVEPPLCQFHSQSPPLSNVAYDDASELPEVLIPPVTVTISPPSSVSPDTSLEIDFGPTSPTPEASSPDFQELTPSDDVIPEILECVAASQEIVDHAEEETTGSSERSSMEQGFLWYRWQKRGQRRDSLHRSASVELWSGRYDYNSSEITYVSLTL